MGGGGLFAGGDGAGPVDEEGDAEAAVVDVAFGSAEVFVGALQAVEAVVGGEDEDGVFAQAAFVEGVEQAADVVIEGFDHGGVGGDFLFLADALAGFWVAFFAPEVLEQFGAAGDGGAVRCVVVEVYEEGVGFVFFDEGDGVVGEAIGEPFAIGAFCKEGVFKGCDVASAGSVVAFCVAARGVAPPEAADVFVEAAAGGVVGFDGGAPVRGQPGEVAILWLAEFFAGGEDRVFALGIGSDDVPLAEVAEPVTGLRSAARRRRGARGRLSSGRRYCPRLFLFRERARNRNGCGTTVVR